jgi:hypothetical protein
MRCNEVQERFIDLLYSEKGTPSASPELQGHINSCPDCRRELEELRNVREVLVRWEDEEPVRPLPALGRKRAEEPRPRAFWNILKYAAVAVMAVLSILAISNAEYTSNERGTSIKTHLFRDSAARSEVYSKAEVRDLLKQVMDESELRNGQTTYRMIQVMMDTLEEERSQDLMYVKKVVRQGAAAKN